MKKKLSLLMVAFLSVMAFAATLTWKAPDTASEVTLDFTAQGYDNGAVVSSLTVEGVTVAFDKGTNSNAPKYYTAGTAVRCYGGNTFALSSEKTITKAVFTFGSGDGTNEITADKGTFETDTWTGSENAVTFTIGGTTGNRRIQKIVVTLSGEAAAVAKPVIAGETPFLGTTNVTITCATEGAAIHYTTDGTAPTAESTAYTEPFAISATTTVKAIAVKDADQSEVAEKTFTAMEGTATLAELNALENGATFGYTGEAKVVAKPTANHVYVTDASGAALIYDASGEKTTAAEVGKTIAANWTGKVSIYNQLTELVPDAALVMKDGEAVAVEYPEVAAADMIAENVNRVVTLKGITGYAVDGKNITITIGETTVVGYNQFGLEIAAAEDGKTYEMVGAIGRYKETIQFQPISIARTPEVVDVTVDAADITADITAALNAKTTAITEAGDIVGNITINLEAGAYTVSAPIVAGGNVVINGNGATIDASALAGNFIEMAVVENPTTEWTEANVTVKELTVKGLKKALFYSACKNYFGDVTVDKCVVEQAADATTFDYTKGSTAVNFTVTNSTFYAPTATTKSLYSSQSGQKITEYKEDATQTFTFTNNTMYNLAKTKNFFTHRQANQKWLAYNVKNNIFVNCGKSGQVIKGMNGGQGGANPTWAIDGNVFNFDGADTGAAEDTGDADEPVQNTIAGVVTFTDAANGNFNGTLTLSEGASAPAALPGDPRWSVKIPSEEIVISPASGDISEALQTAIAGKVVGNITINLTADVTYTVTNTIDVPAGLTINGNGATIDGSALTTPMIQMSTTPTVGVNAKDAYLSDGIVVKDVKITGLKYQFIYGNKMKYLLAKLSVENSIIAVDGTNNKTIFDFNGGGNASEIIINKSTIYANPSNEQNGGLFSSQSGHGSIQDLGSDKQLFAITNSTIYNVAYGKTTSSQRRNNTAGMEYKVENSIIVNSGKNGQFIVGLNGGAANSVQTYTASNNVFNFDGAETSAAEEAKVQEKITEFTMTSINGVVVFADAANGDFNADLNVATAPVGPTVPVGDPRWTISAKQVPVDVVISPADGDIAAALATASEGKLVKDIIINLTKDVTYTVSAALVAPNSITINGNGAIIDASALDANLVQWTAKAAEDTEWTEANVAITAVTVKGLKKALFYSNSKYYYGNFSLINSVIEQAGDATTFDYTKGSTALNFTVAGSTIYAPTATTKSLYSSQGGQRATEYKSDATQNFVFSVNTMYNLAKSKNFFSHRQSNQAWMSYTVQYNVFVNCGKSGQVIKGMNGGQGGANPTWTIKGNVFNFDGADTSAAEDTGDAYEPVQESVAGVVTFTDAANGDFNGSLLLAPETTSIPEALGDARWTLSTVASYAITEAATEHGTFVVKVADAEVTYAAAETAVAIIATPDADYEVDAVTVKDADEADVTVTKLLGQENAYGFTMPAKAVTVTVTFKEKGGTGIKVVEADALENAVIYNMQGVRVEKAEKGLYIVNGKKVVLK